VSDELDALRDERDRLAENLSQSQWAHEHGLSCPYCKHPCGGAKWEDGQCLVGLWRADLADVCRQIERLVLVEREETALKTEPHVRFEMPVGMLISLNLTREEEFEQKLRGSEALIAKQTP